MRLDGAQQPTFVNLTIQGRGPPVLFLHGIPTCGRLWDDVVAKLRDAVTCVVVDLPGSGASPAMPGGSLDPSDYARTMDAIRERLGLPSWSIVGHDAGATIAIHYAVDYSSRLQRLALCSPPVFPDFKVPWFFRLLRSPLLGDCLAPFVCTFLWRAGIRRAMLRRGPEIDDIVKAFHRPYTGFRGARRMLHLLRWGDPVHVLARTAALLPQIAAPTLVVHGRRDGAIPLSFATRAASLIPAAALKVLDCGHFLPLDCADELCRHMRLFLL